MPQRLYSPFNFLHFGGPNMAKFIQLFDVRLFHRLQHAGDVAMLPFYALDTRL